MIILGKEIKIKDKYCQVFDYPVYDIENPYCNIQIKLPGCNANCLFCESKSSYDFNEDELFKKLEIINNEISIYKINFTGGEPTLNNDRLKRLIVKTRNILPKSYIVLNTNGYNLIPIFDFLNEYIDNVQLSRHHYLDEINNKILGFNSIKLNDIQKMVSNLKNKRFFNLSCNLIKGYIDNKNDIFNYLETSSNIGVKWVGFVTLIPLNQYCIDNIIDINELNIIDERLIMTKHSKYISGGCQCYNYIYLPLDKSDPVKVYNKWTEKTDIEHIFTYDGLNFNIGFTNNKLI